MDKSEVIRDLARRFKYKKDFVQILGVSHSTLNFWIKGERNPKLEHVVKMCNVARFVAPTIHKRFSLILKREYNISAEESHDVQKHKTGTI